MIVFNEAAPNHTVKNKKPHRTAPYDSRKSKSKPHHTVLISPGVEPRRDVRVFNKTKCFAMVRVWCNAVFNVSYRTALYDFAFNKTAPNRTVRSEKQNSAPHRTAPHRTVRFSKTKIRTAPHSSLRACQYDLVA